MTRLTVSSVEIDARNKLNGLANQVRAELLAILAPYQGKKVIKFTPYKGWVAKIKPAMDAKQEALQAMGYRLVFTFNDHSVWADLDRSITIPGEYQGVKYLKCQFGIAGLDGGDVLKASGNPLELYRTDYTPEGVNSTLARIASLEEEIRTYKGQVAEFTR